MSNAEKVGKIVGSLLGWTIMVSLVYFVLLLPIGTYAYVMVEYPSYGPVVFTFWATILFGLSLGKVWSAIRNLNAQKKITKELNTALQALKETGVDLNEAVVKEAFEELTRAEH